MGLVTPDPTSCSVLGYAVVLSVHDEKLASQRARQLTHLRRHVGQNG